MLEIDNNRLYYQYKNDRVLLNENDVYIRKNIDTVNIQIDYIINQIYKCKNYVDIINAIHSLSLYFKELYSILEIKIVNKNYIELSINDIIHKLYDVEVKQIELIPNHKLSNISNVQIIVTI